MDVVDAERQLEGDARDPRLELLDHVRTLAAAARRRAAAASPWGQRAFEKMCPNGCQAPLRYDSRICWSIGKRSVGVVNSLIPG